MLQLTAACSRCCHLENQLTPQLHVLVLILIIIISSSSSNSSCSIDVTFIRSHQPRASTGCATPPSRCQQRQQQLITTTRRLQQHYYYYYYYYTRVYKHWMRQSAISFHRLKLTNNVNDQRGNVTRQHPFMQLV